MAYVFAYTTSAKDIFWKVPGKFESLLEPTKSESEDSEANVSVIPKSKSWPEWISSKIFGSAETAEVGAQDVAGVDEPSWEVVAEDFQGAEFCLQVRPTLQMSALRRCRLSK